MIVTFESLGWSPNLGLTPLIDNSGNLVWDPEGNQVFEENIRYVGPRSLDYYRNTGELYEAQLDYSYPRYAQTTVNATTTPFNPTAVFRPKATAGELANQLAHVAKGPVVW